MGLPPNGLLSSNSIASRKHKLGTIHRLRRMPTQSDPSQRTRLRLLSRGSANDGWRPCSRWLHPISKRRAKFSASHATLDPDRACSAAQDGTPSLSKAAIRLTQIMKAGDTFLYVPGNPANHNHRRPQCGITMTAPQHWIELRRTLVFGAGVLP